MSSLMGGTPKAQKPIPMPDEEAVEREKRRSQGRRIKSSRSSTILSDGGDDTLG